MVSDANSIEAKISSGAYIGDPVKVQFGKPTKILVRGKDVTDCVVELHIEISRRGQLIHLSFAEVSPKLIGGGK